MTFNKRTETSVRGLSLTSPFQTTLAVPTGTIKGDLMFTWISSNSASVVTNTAWTLVSSCTASMDKHYLFTRVASDESSGYVWTFSGTSKYEATCKAYITSTALNSGSICTGSIPGLIFTVEEGAMVITGEDGTTWGYKPVKVWSGSAWIVKGHILVKL